MKRTTLKGIPAKLALGLLVLVATAAPSFAAELAAVPAEWTPPGGGVPIAMWAFVDAEGDANSYTCPVTPVPWAVGPSLTATAGGSLTVNLKNCLADPVSIFIPGQLKETFPVMFTDGQGRSRVRSFDTETAPDTVGMYTWNGDGLTGVKEGTYLYHSGTHPQVQVQMGLYGALTVGSYGYTSEATLVYSEIDPALHAAVDDLTYGTAAYPSTFDYMPRYFLINGAAYPDGTDIVVDTVTDVLLRFVNAGLRTHVPTLEGGLYMSLIAEDGNLYKDGNDNSIPFEQYGIELQAAKTIDAVINVETAGRYALYDRALGLTNWMDTGGGMLTYIQAGAAADAPTAVFDAYATAEDVTLNVSAPGVLGNDLDADGTSPIPATYEAILVSNVANGSLTLNTAGSFDYEPDSLFNGTVTFSYQAVDTTAGPNSNVATVTITVTPVNNPPTANDDPYDVLEGTTLSVAAPGVLGNDVDVDGDMLTATAVGTPPPGILLLATDGSFDYTPAGAAGAIETFGYEACDPSLACDAATVRITVVANTAPEAIDDDAGTTPGNTPVVINVVANDLDEEGNLDPTTVIVTAGPTSGSVTNFGDGTILYTPGLLGPDSFTYTVSDTLGATSNVATVDITVTNSAPVANDDFATTTRNNAVDILVVANDVDVDGVIVALTVDLDPDTPNEEKTVSTTRGGTATVDAFGEVTFTPKRGSRGTDLFTYTVKDNNGALSNVATVRVNVLK